MLAWPERVAISRLARQRQGVSIALVLNRYGDCWYSCIASVASETGVVEEPPQPPISYRRDDRRAHARVPVNLPLRYTVLPRRRRLRTGEGRTLNVSSSGVCFIADGPLQPGNRIEVAMDWPQMLHGDVPLRLVALGTVVWAQGDHVGLQFQRREFKTREAGPDRA